MCLNLGKAQVAPVVPAQTTQPAAPVAPSNPINGILTSIQTPIGKYDEYQSICRENKYDIAAYLKPEAQQERIDALNEKIKKTLVTSKLKLLLLKEYIDQKKNAEAEKYFKKLKEEKLTDEDNKTADAFMAVVKGDLKRAEDLLTKVVLNNPKNQDALKFLAEIYVLDGNFYEATTAYLDLKKMTKENYDLELCEIHTLYSQHAESDRICKLAAQKNPSNPYPLIFLGISRRENLNYIEAIRLFKNSLRISPTEMGFTCMGEIYFIKENYAAAAESFKRASQISLLSARAELGLAWSYFKNKNYSESATIFKLACRKEKSIKSEIRRAYKLLLDEKSKSAIEFADLVQSCGD